MACFEALNGPTDARDPSILTRASDLYRHALLLNGGPEATLGYSAMALTVGAGGEDALKGALSRCQALQPLNAAVYHLLGLVMERARAYKEAVQLLRICQKLLEMHPAGPEGPAVAGGAQLVPPRTGSGLLAPVLLDLARLQLKSADAASARSLYAYLDGKGKLEGPYELLAYAAAVSAARGVPGVDAALAARAVAASTGNDDDLAHVALAAVRGAQGPTAAAAAAEAATAVALGHGGAVAARAHLTAAVVAATAGDAVAARRHADTATSGAGLPAEVTADANTLRAAVAATPPAAVRACLYAIHTCPWSAAYRSLAVAVAAGSPAADAPPVAPTATQPGPPAAMRLAGRNAGIPSRRARDGLAMALVAAQRAVHVAPGGMYGWYNLAMILTQSAVLGVSVAPRAVKTCRQAMALLDSHPSLDPCLRVHLDLALSMVMSMPFPEGASGGASAPLAICPNRLQLALSHARAASTAAASAPELAHLHAQCELQIARCHSAAGDADAAEMTLRTACGHPEGGDPASVLALALHLLDGGRCDEAVSVLSAAAGSATATEWLPALHTARVNALCLASDLEGARAAVGQLRGVSAATGGVVFAAYALKAAELLCGAPQNMALLEVRASLKPAGAFGERVDLGLVAALLNAAAERSRGRLAAAEEWQRLAAEVAAGGKGCVQDSLVAGTARRLRMAGMGLMPQ
jgi:hypothetical protein